MSGTAFVPVSHPAVVRRGVLAIWRVLPRALAAGFGASVACAPLAAALLAAAPGWILALATLPPMLAATGLSGFATRALRDEALPVASWLRTDPVLALVLAAAAALAALLLTSPGSAQLAGAVVAALLLLVGLPALAYGAVRGRSGLSALRGGAILAIVRPGWTLTLASLAVLAAFAAVASAGVLALVAGPMLLGVAVSATAAQLDEIDHLQGVAG